MKLFQSIVCVLLFTGTCLAQESSDKVISLNVSGEGKTKEEALQVALRGAIEQAFGTFISSNTQVLNDELTKDEILSISNGNIQKYETLSEVQLPSGQYATTVKAIVSVSKLTSFCENKGIEVEFKGALFAINVKQQIINEQNEIKAIGNMCKVLNQISDHSFDFAIRAIEPTKNVKSTDKWEIPIVVEIKANNNLKKMSDYLSATLNGLKLTKGDVENYVKLKKDVFVVAYCPMDYSYTSDKKKKSKNVKDIDILYNNSLFYFRRNESIELIANAFFYFQKSILKFVIKNGLENIHGTNVAKRDYKNGRFPEFSDKTAFFLPMLVDYDDRGPTPFLVKSNLGWEWRLDEYSPHDPRSFDEKIGFINAIRSGVPEPGLQRKQNMLKYFSFLNDISQDYPLFEDLIISFQNIKVGQTVAEISFKDIKTVDELSKISEYTISPNHESSTK